MSPGRSRRTGSAQRRPALPRPPRRPAAARCGRSPSRTRSPRCRRSPLPRRSRGPPRPGRQHHANRACDVVAEAAPPGHRHLDLAVGGAGGGAAGERERVASVARHAEPDRDLSHQRLRSGPVGDVALHQASGGEDVDEDVLAAPLDGPVSVVMHVLEVPGCDRGGDYERRGDVDHQLRQPQIGPRGSSRQAGSVSVSSTRTNSTRTGKPIRTRSGLTCSSSPTIRTPSVSCTSATTIGSDLPGTGGWCCTTKLYTSPVPAATMYSGLAGPPPGRIGAGGGGG